MYMLMGKEILNDLCSTKYINDLSSLTYNVITIFKQKVSYLGYLLKNRVPTSSGNHGKPGKSQKKFHAWKNHGI